MSGDDNHLHPERRAAVERRSRSDSRSELEKQQIGERRSGIDRRDESQTEQTGVSRPPDAQLALFARRLRRALRGEKSRDYFGVARGEDDFVIYPEVLKTIEWIESLASPAAEDTAQSAQPFKGLR